MRHRRLALIAVLAAVLAAPAGASGATLTEIGSFNQPLYAVSPPGDTSRVMVVQKGGVIRVVRGGAQSTFLDVAAAVGGIAASGEQGLLSMAFAPDYAASGRFYVYYTAADGQSNRVAEFTVSADRSVANTTPRPVISIPHTTASNHNGGQVEFGPDGMLYIAPGDGGNTPANAQSTANLSGKVLRIDPRGGTPYAIPPGNPYAGSGDPGADEILHIGLRNPYRFSFDRLTGDLIIGDVGGGLREEITLAPAGTPAGRNFGWAVCEGSCSGAPPADHFGPALQYSQGSPRAVTGGIVVRDPALPELNGCYLYGDFYEGAIRATTLSAGAAAGHGTPTGLSVEGLASFGTDDAGRVYVTALSGGKAYRLDSTGAPRANCATAPPTAGTGPGIDLTAPRLVTKTARRQRVLRQRGVLGHGRCSNEACSVAMSGRLRIGRLSYPLLRTVRAAGANRRVRLRVRLTARATRALRRALRRKRRATVTVAYRARDGAANRSGLRRTTVRVRR